MLYSAGSMWRVLALSQHASVSDNSMAWGTGYSSGRPLNGEARGVNGWSERSFVPPRQPDRDRHRIPVSKTRCRPAGVSRPGDGSLRSPGLRSQNEFDFQRVTENRCCYGDVKNTYDFTQSMIVLAANVKLFGAHTTIF